MKRVLCAIVVLMISMALLCPVWATEDTFVPSISYKDGPEILESEMSGEETNDCLVVSSLKNAAEKTTDITQDARDLLLSVYDKLDSGEMTIPMEEGYVVRELIDVSWKHKNCVSNEEHFHEEELEKEGVTITVDLSVGLRADDSLLVFAYRNGEWDEIEWFANNGDGTVTCVFEHFCPVAFCVKTNQDNDQTGDITAQSMLLWIALMVVSATTIAVLSYNRRKYAR